MAKPAGRTVAILTLHYGRPRCPVYSVRTTSRRCGAPLAAVAAAARPLPQAYDLFFFSRVIAAHCVTSGPMVDVDCVEGCDFLNEMRFEPPAVVCLLSSVFSE